ncbi:MAG TPA: hypothetical protein VN612_02930, partial [Acidobacteriaceae bacterium]|nr:hypothetical protein [Acidobacteriaceae bacterium]
RYGDYKWHRLPSDAADAHTAISDCRAALKLIQSMAAARLSTETDLREAYREARERVAQQNPQNGDLFA